MLTYADALPKPDYLAATFGVRLFSLIQPLGLAAAQTKPAAALTEPAAALTKPDGVKVL